MGKNNIVPQKYLKKVDAKTVFMYTEILAARTDMIECDVDGNRVDLAPVQEKAPEPKPVTEVEVPVEPAIEDKPEEKVEEKPAPMVKKPAKAKSSK